jgi:hypothetical protein
MLLYHNGVLLAIHGVLRGTCYDDVLRTCLDNGQLCASNDHRLLCSGTHDHLLRSDHNLLSCRASDILQELLSGNVYVPDVLHVLSTLVVAMITSRFTDQGSNAPCRC